MMFRLALAMGCTVAELNARLSIDEWADWIAFYSLNPWGTSVEDDRWNALLGIQYNKARGNNPPIIEFFDRDPEETERLRVEREKKFTLEDQVRAYFMPRVTTVEGDKSINN